MRHPNRAQQSAAPVPSRRGSGMRPTSPLWASAPHRSIDDSPAPMLQQPCGEETCPQPRIKAMISKKRIRIQSLAGRRPALSPPKPSNDYARRMAALLLERRRQSRTAFVGRLKFFTAQYIASAPFISLIVGPNPPPHLLRSRTSGPDSWPLQANGLLEAFHAGR
jgi:hypothetical protein